MILVSLLTIVIAFSLVLLQYRRKHKVELASKFDGPPTLPLIGNLHQLVSGSTKNTAATLLNWCEKYRSGFRIWIANELYIVLMKPEDVQIFSSLNLEKSWNHRFLCDVIGDGLVTCSSAKAKGRRRTIGKALTSILRSNSIREVFNRQNCRMISRMNKEVGSGNHFDVLSYLFSASFRAICENSMGYDEENDDSGHIIRTRDAQTAAAALAASRSYAPWLHPDIIFDIYLYLTGYGEHFKTAQELPRRIINEKRRQIDEKKGLIDNEIDPNGKTKTNLLELLMQKQEEDDPITDEELVDEMLTTLTAGSETSALIDGFTLLMLAMHQDIQEKVFEEQRGIFQNSNRMPAVEDLDKMNFLEQCLKETMRLFPSVPALYRSADADIPVSDGKVIPAGSTIIVATFGIQRDKNVYPEPEKWNPDNFDPERVIGRNPNAFLPFGVGPRSCIGSKYATLSLKTQLSFILRNYKVTTDRKMDDVELVYDFALRSKHGFPIKLNYRGAGSIF